MPSMSSTFAPVSRIPTNATIASVDGTTTSRTGGRFHRMNADISAMPQRRQRITSANGSFERVAAVSTTPQTANPSVARTPRRTPSGTLAPLAERGPLPPRPIV